MLWTWGLYALLLILLFARCRPMGPGRWNEEYTTLPQVNRLRAFTAVGVALHHMSHKTSAHWVPDVYRIPGLELFVDAGYLFVGVFLFTSGMGLYKSLHGKQDYLLGFFRRRVLPVTAAFALSNLVFLLVRLAVGQSISWGQAALYLTGLSLCNYNGWYAVAIPLFYLAFYLSFRFCRREGAALLWVFAFTLLYVLICAFTDHSWPFWFAGEWWYNSSALFPLGILFAKYEGPVTRFARKGYWLLLPACVLGLFALRALSGMATNVWWGYYGENWGDPYKVLHRLGSAISQWLVAADYAALCFLILMKVRLGGRSLAFLSGLLLEFYLMHGLFVQLFGFDFLGVGRSLLYIRSMPLYILAVLLCSVPSAMALKWFRLHIFAHIPPAPRY